MSTYAPARPTKYCENCGGVIDARAVLCTKCGVLLPGAPGLAVSEKKILPAFALCFFLGPLGAHRFYVGKPGTAILQILTLGGLGVWYLIDLIMIGAGAFKDGDGEKLADWT
jgi:hypothetical protein